MQNFYNTVLTCLLEQDIDKKLNQLQNIQQDLVLDKFNFTPTKTTQKVADPGRPTLPELTAPKFLPKRKLGSKEGHAALIHSIAHIEFNAINLALDALYRFQDMPKAYYNDWLGVALEESYHFQMIREHLFHLGYNYGYFNAHNGLWVTTFETDHDPLIRMALVPRTLEARGLDVTPPMINKLRAIGDKKGVEILKILLKDEIGHVEVGSRWFNYLCEKRNLNPVESFKEAINLYFHGNLKGPFNYSAREKAGFTAEEITWLKEIEAGLDHKTGS